jgi:hypothetical protein
MVLLGVALIPAAATAADAQCSGQNAVMQGLYVMSGSGSITGVGPLASTGLVQYNGDGTGVLISATNSINGAVSTVSGIPGTYTVNRDCTGTKTFGSGNSAQHFNFVISPDGNTITWISTDNSVTMIGTAVRQRRQN